MSAPDRAPRAGRRAPESRRLVAEIPDPARHLATALAQLSDERVAAWHWPGHLGGPRSEAETEALLVHQAAEHDAIGYGIWWWRERRSGELVGYTGLSRAEVEGSPEVEVGWSIRPGRWGEGFASEAGAASLEWGFEVAELARIVSFTLPENLASRRVMEKIGLRFERVFERKGFTQVLYGLDRETWRGREPTVI